MDLSRQLSKKTTKEKKDEHEIQESQTCIDRHCSSSPSYLKYNCKVCHKTFSCKSILGIHEKTHAGNSRPAPPKVSQTHAGIPGPLLSKGQHTQPSFSGTQPPKGPQTQAGISGSPQSKGQHTQPGFSGTSPPKGPQTQAGISGSPQSKGQHTQPGFSGTSPPKGPQTHAGNSRPAPPKGPQKHAGNSRPSPPKGPQTHAGNSRPAPPKGPQTQAGISGPPQSKGQYTLHGFSRNPPPKDPQTHAGIFGLSPPKGSQQHAGISEAPPFKGPQTKAGFTGPPPPKGLHTRADISSPSPRKGSQMHVGMSRPLLPKSAQTLSDISQQPPLPKVLQTHPGISGSLQIKGPQTSPDISGQSLPKGPQTYAGTLGPLPSKGPQITTNISRPQPPMQGPQVHPGISEALQYKHPQALSGPPPPKGLQTFSGIFRTQHSRCPLTYAAIAGPSAAKGSQINAGISDPSPTKHPQTHADISKHQPSKSPSTHAGIAGKPLSRDPRIQAGISGRQPSKGPQTCTGVSGPSPAKGPQTHAGISEPSLLNHSQTHADISEQPQPDAGITRKPLSRDPRKLAGISGRPPSKGLQTNSGLSQPSLPKVPQTNAGISETPSSKGPQSYASVSRSQIAEGPHNSTGISGTSLSKDPHAIISRHPSSKSPQTHAGISGLMPSEGLQTPTSMPGPTPIIGPYTHADEFPLRRDPQTNTGISGLPSPKSPQMHPGISGSSPPKGPQNHTCILGSPQTKGPQTPARVPGHRQSKRHPTTDSISVSLQSKSPQTPGNISETQLTKGPQTQGGKIKSLLPTNLQTHTDILGPPQPPVGSSGHSLLKRPHTPDSVEGSQPPKIPKIPASISGSPAQKRQQTHTDTSVTTTLKDPQATAGISGMSQPKGLPTPTSIAGSLPSKDPQNPPGISGSSPPKDPLTAAAISESTPHIGLQTFAGASEPLPAMCSVSSKQFETNSSCKENLQQVHGAGDIQKEGEANKCNICSKQFQTQLALKCHFHYHKSKDTYAQHTPSDQETKAYACSQCNFKTNSQGSMRNHLRRHYILNQTGQSVAPKQRSLKKTKLGVDASQHKASSKGDNGVNKKKTRNTKSKPRKDLLPRTSRNEGISKDNKVIKPKPQRKARKNKTDKDPYKFSSDDASEPQSKSVVTKAKRIQGKGVRKSVTAKAKAVRSKVGKVRQRKGKTDPNQCSYCKTAFKSKVHLKYHIFFCEPAQNKVYICSICGRGHRLKWKLDKHMLLAHGSSSQAQDFTDTAAFTSHLKDHKGESSVSQSLTEVSAERNLLSNELLRHEQSLGKLCTCTICGVSFSTDLLLGVHITMMHSKSGENETDEACISSSNNTRGIDKHSYQKTDPFDYLVDTRDKKLTGDMFPKEFDIYTCDICGSNFTQRMHIEKHIRNHLNVHSSTQNTADLSEKEKGIEYAVPETAQGDIVSLNTNNDRAPTLEQHISFKLMPSESILKLYLALSREDRNLLRKRIKEEFSLSMYLVDASEMSGPDSDNHVCLVCMAKFTKHQNLTRHILYKPFEHVLYFEGKPSRMTPDAQSLVSHINMPDETRMLHGTKLSATCLKVMQEFISMVLNKMTFFKNIGISKESLTVLMDSTEPTSLSTGQSKLQIVKDIMRLSGTTAVERQIYDSFSDSFSRTGDSLLQGKSQDDDDEHDVTDEEKDNPPSSVDNRLKEGKMDTNDSTDSAMSRFEEDIYEECPQLTPQTMLSDNIETADQIDIKTEVYVDMDMGEDTVETSTDANMNRNESNCTSEQLTASKEQHLETDELTEPLISKPPSVHEHFRVLKTEPIFTEVPTEEPFSDAPDMDRMIGQEPAEHPSSQPANVGDLISQVSTENVPGSASNIEQLIMKPYCYTFEPLIKQTPLEDTTPLDDTSSCHSDEGDVTSQPPMMQDSVVGTAKPTTHPSTEHNALSGAPSTGSLTKPAPTEKDSSVAFNSDSLINQSPQDNTTSMDPNTGPPINQSTSEDMPHATTSNDCAEGNTMCPHCETVIHVGQKTVKCHLCCFQYCIACSHLSSDVQSQMEKASEYESGYVWMCAVCKPLLPRLAVIMTNLGDLEHGLNNRLSDLETKVNGIQQVFRESRLKDV